MRWDRSCSSGPRPGTCEDRVTGSHGEGPCGSSRLRAVWEASHCRGCDHSQRDWIAAMAKARIAILVVAYNAESTLCSVLERIPATIMEKVEEIVVFDDASHDRTYEVGAEYRQRTAQDKLSIFRNPVNLMYGGNQQRGYAYAIERGYDIVVLLHGDGQYAPEVMQALLTPLETGRAEMVMGSRMLIEGAALRGHMPRYKY